MKNLKRLLIVVSFFALFSCSGDDNFDENIKVSNITVEGLNITDGGSTQMTAIVTPNNATNKNVTWSVSNTAIATISMAGNLTAISNGSVKVTATAKDGSGVSGDKTISVSGVTIPPVLVTSIIISGSDITDGQPKQLSVEVLPENANNKEVTWTVSDSGIAEISTNGLLTPKANGSVVVTATSTDGSGVSNEITIHISGLNQYDGIIVSTSQELLNAFGNANSGDKIYLRGGEYTFSSRITISKSGNETNLISLIAYPDDAERPRLNFSSMAENSSNRGIQLEGDYWYFYGIDIFGAGDNGMFISGNNNLIEFCTFSENSDTGLQIGNGGSYNTILNCDSFYNADSSLENADGFASKLDAGTGNKFIGCRAWQNLDDGWDGYLRGNDNITTTYQNCWAFKNGYLKDGSAGAGDGNGFKTGGSDDKLLKHNAIYTNCIAAGNIYDGFDHNSNRGDIEIYNCSSYSNGRNISFSSTNIANSLTIKNTISVASGSNDSFNATNKDITNNSWQNGLNANANDFVSLNIELLSAPRKADGSLPDVDFMKLVSGSDLIDKGVNIGLPYNGSAPDLGAFEYE